MDERVSRDPFVRYYAMANSGITLDQADAVWSSLGQTWMKPGTASCHARYARRDTVFNVLLHFTTQVLSEHNGKPVCRYEHLLRWHELSSLLSEDMLTTSYLAGRDLHHRVERRSFDWPTVIDHDNRALNNILQRPVTDLHFHLNGSSLNFEMNWMSLMNKIAGWNDEFRRFKYSQQGMVTLTEDEKQESFYLQVIKATALRTLLFEYAVAHCQISAINSTDRALAESLLAINKLDDARGQTKQLDLITARLRCRYGKKYCEGHMVKTPDYATMDCITMGVSKQSNNYVFTVLAGERWLLYTLFRDIYGNSKHIPKEIITWFYAYILIKAQFRTEFVQVNSLVGFANFANYETRKSRFIHDRSVYAKLLCQMAAESFLGNGKNRHLEARMVPKTTSKALQRFVSNTDRSIRNSMFQGSQVVNDDNMKYVLHFIKKKDEKSPKDASLGHCRHYDLRYTVKRQSLAVSNLRKKQGSERYRIVGMDAANSEILTRPEVFAQAFRFLRDDNATTLMGKMPNDLGMTYHVGEDFMDVVDGLRAVDEVIHFLGFRNGDRLGHGLVLGIDVKKYYSFRHQTVSMTAQTLLDNTVWLYNVGKDCQSFVRASRELEILYEKYYQQVFCGVSIKASMWDYYQSWLLRGDAPGYYYLRNQKGKHRQQAGWSMYNLNHDADVELARTNDTACCLYAAYHYEKDVRERGRKTVQEKLNDAIISLIEEVQEKMLDEVERRNLCIECNPTSNLRIATIEGYSKHPIARFFNDTLFDNKNSHYISVSVNTDDKGIFATSLEREYSLLALSLEKKAIQDRSASPRQIYEWIDKIRQMGLEQLFE